MTEQTLSIVKPDAVQNGHIGDIVARFEKSGLSVVAMRMLHFSRAQAEAFYAVHNQRPFFASLVEYMTSGPVVALVLQGAGAIQKNRDLMGATDPAKAGPNTFRKDFGESIERNAVHGSDAADTAKVEIAYLFAGLDICRSR